MQKRFLKPIYFYFEFAFLVLLVSVAGVVIAKKLSARFIDICVAIFVSIISWRSVRGIPMFGLFLIPVVAGNLSCFLENHSAGVKKNIHRFALAVSVVMLIPGLFLTGHFFSKGKTVGIGLMPKAHYAAAFLRENGIDGPIFNNYDIGGYLIFHLFPDYRVFVDNRPEAYATSFFKDTYIPMQEDEGVWRRMDAKYKFNTIFFYRRDFTPWAQPFLIRRIQDPGWAAVFVDAYSLILVKRNAKNANTIRLYELPKEIFRFEENS